MAWSQSVVTTREKLPKIAWLNGEWQGVGYRPRTQNAKPAKAEFSLFFEKDSLRIIITSEGQTLFREKLDPESEYHHVELNGTEITLYFFPDEYKYNNVELKILQLGKESINVSLVHNRYPMTTGNRVIFQATFTKK